MVCLLHDIKSVLNETKNIGPTIVQAHYNHNTQSILTRMIQFAELISLMLLFIKHISIQLLL